MFLTYIQIVDYRQPIIKKDTFVAVDIEDDASIKMTLDVVFPRCPCECKWNKKFNVHLVLDVILTSGYV